MSWPWVYEVVVMDDKWKYYDITHKRHVLCNPLSERKFQRLCRLLGLTRGARVLDVACGSGAFLSKHASHVGRIAGLDHSEDLIDIALRDNHERVAAGTAQFVVGDATELPWADNQFSAVTSNCVSCFETKARPALEEMYRVLRPGGRAAIGDDRHQMMETVGFTQVSRQFGGMLTSGFKE